ncbi:regulatory protein, LuxR [Leucobacter sp. 7(1)]|uniref:LuxR family transcriptional regulator n=1 Tax=Leucobacter sp. 7(1) TaxID=1255613 RepID=UPI00097E7AAB|nr:LuxR family transcriptional regulator [Leucobacter sp. 7(1)]SJN12905.1 regulatory protein, LuxR [Leucobacter sp. 7(1)]
MIDAVRRALATGDEGAARSALRTYWLRLILESRTAELEALCATEGTPGDPNTLLIRACCRDLQGDHYGAAFLRAQGLRGASDDFLRCFAELLLAPDARAKAQAADRAHLALAECGPDDDYPAALFLLGFAEVRLRRDFARATALLRSACDEARLHGRPELLRLAQSNLAFALTHAGEFAAAEALLAQLPETEARSDWERFEGGSPGANRGCIAFWRGDFDTALQHLDGVIDVRGPGTNFEALARLYLVMCVVTVRRTERYLTAGQLLRGVSTDDKHGVPWDTLRRVTAAWLAAAHGERAEAIRIAGPALDRPGAAVAHALLAELFRVLGEPAAARQAIQLAQAAGLPRYAQASVLVTAAALGAESGQGSEAHALLEQALATAASERVLAPFLAADPVLADLVNAHARWGSRHPEFLQAVLTRRSTHDGAALRLTTREREVFAYLRTPMTAEEIAVDLGVAYPTVKTHIRSIYRKLGVTQRRDAVAAVDEHALRSP